MLDNKKYTGFIPKNFQEKNNKIQTKGRKKAVILIIILNFIMLPLNISELCKENKSDISFEKDLTEVRDTNTVNSISKWLSIAEDEIKIIKVENSKGIVKVSNGSQIVHLEELGIKIDKIETKNDSIEVGVSL